MNIVKFKYKIIIISSIFLLLGIIFGISISNKTCNVYKLKYIDPNLNCSENPIVKKSSYIQLKHDLEEYIQIGKDKKAVTDVSIYFRDLSNGPTLGINEHSTFSPASLLKLPLLLAYENMKNENSPDIFSKKITAETTWTIPEQVIPPANSITLGNVYSIDKMLSYMIQYSDNNSYYVLLDYLHKNYTERDILKDTFVSLGIVDPKDFLEDTISVKSYGSIFTQLYYSSYFNKKETSDEVLEMLTKTDWSNGINMGVPANIKVAHKFGERVNIEGNLSQLHDCGIVYYPGNPYLLCIMTRGDDLTKLSKVIGVISGMVYDEFNSRKL